MRDRHDVHKVEELKKIERVDIRKKVERNKRNIPEQANPHFGFFVPQK
jgi:hypothetical protein